MQIGADTPNGVPIVPIKFVKEIDSAQLHRSSPGIEARFVGSRIIGGDVLISVKGTIGRVGIVPVGFNGNIAREIARLRIKTAECPKYVMHQLEGDHTQRRITDAVVGTTRLEFSIAAVRKFEIAVPPTISEKKAIAQALSDVESLTMALSRLIVKKRDLRIGAMQSLVTGDFRLSGFSGDWKVRPLGDVIPIKKGQLITSQALKPGSVPVIAGGRQPAYFHASANRFGRTVTISASGASAGYVALHNEPIFASDCSTISESKDYCLDYIYYQLLLEQQTIYEAQTGGAQPHINPKDLNPIPFRFPPVSEQAAIAEVISDMDAEITALEARLEKTRALKQGMMQALLTGRVRLPVQGQAVDALEVAHA